jgi:hypothetical protein
VVEEVAENWAHTLKWSKNENLPNKARLVPLVRARFDYEVSSLQTALQLKRASRELMDVFVHQPLADHLDVIIAEDAPDRYNQVTRPLLEQLKLSWNEALRLAMWNLPQIDPGFGSSQPFEQREAGYWIYAGEPSELFTSWLLFPEKVRRLRVKGKHVAFVPKVSLLAITGTDELATLERLIAMTIDALSKSEGRTVSAVPFVLEASGWKPWLPPASHPLYWAIKELHVTEFDNHYEAQTELLKELLDRDFGDEAPFVASYKVGQFGEHAGAAVVTSQCIWPETVDALLPKTEVVILKQLLNRDELEQNEDAEPEFGNWLTLTWQQLADYLGPRLKRLDYFPERYEVRGDDFPAGDDWQRLEKVQPELPLEGMPGTMPGMGSSMPGASPAPLPVLVPAAADKAVDAVTGSPTQLARPLPVAADPKPPPEPSWWPLLGVCLLATCCLGGSVGAVILGIQQVQTLVAGGLSPPQPQGGQPAINPPWQPAPAAPAWPQPQFALEPPIAAPQPLDVEKMQNDVRDAMQRMERHIARNFPAAQPPAADPPAAIPPAPPLGKPEQELPLLEFGPQDVSPVGPEIRGDEIFQDIAPAGGWLVGLRAVKGESWGGSILALQPIYQVGGEYKTGQQCGGGFGGLEHVQLLAKPGYAVGKIEARFGLIMNAVRVHFYRVDGQRLNAADAHASDWVGGDGGGLTELDGQGAPLVGIAGSYHPRDEVITIQALRKKP